MRTIKSVSNIQKRNDVTYSGHVYMYADANTPLAYAHCPLCNGNIYNGMISCPDGREGCCVSHYGYGCSKCLQAFTLDVEWEGVAEQWTVKEKIGIGIINPRGLLKLTITPNSDKEGK